LSVRCRTSSRISAAAIFYIIVRRPKRASEEHADLLKFIFIGQRIGKLDA
jgi:threonine/homoserine efflux transporter RhtA